MPNKQSSSSRHSHPGRVADEDSAAQSTKLAQAEAAIEKRDYAAAETVLQQLTSKGSPNYEAWFDLGFVENALGNQDASIAAYQKSVAAKPQVFESNLNLGLQLAKTGSPDAEKFLRAATQLKPASQPEEGRYRAWLALGDLLNKTNPTEAIASYQQAEQLQPKQAEPHLAAGVLFEQGNQAAEAEQEYKRVLAFDPESSEASAALANLYMRGRRFPEAEIYLRKSAAAHPESAAIEVQLGRVLAAEGKNDEAVTILEAGIKLSPGDDEARGDLASVYVASGKNDLAEAAFRELLKTHPKDPELHRSLGQAVLRQKRYAAAQKEFLVTVQLKPEYGEAYGDLAFAADENQDYGLALKALDARAKFLPEIPITYFLRASASDHLRDMKIAAVNYHLFLNSAEGKYPVQEWQARHRLIAIEPKK